MLVVSVVFSGIYTVGVVLRVFRVQVMILSVFIVPVVFLRFFRKTVPRPADGDARQVDDGKVTCTVSRDYSRFGLEADEEEKKEFEVNL